ncbi:MAG: hydroxymethylglutaryl-CoA lyase [Crocinitomicaceae bacterium]|jgi:hydroxymethylglutaryl-CoA lyase|nr:hydroxymethylglutaryl-CoA lyase [Crocinitomicaceae bacterium]MDG2463578.1 hydroxymethylglutaryl-CoA lyase [Crocinitomicaceae bacterium]
MKDEVIIAECPRDAMQGWHDFISTEKKIDYLNVLLECGFDVLDFGSFVSPKAIPQMKDTAEVLKNLKLNDKTKMLTIIANERGANDACEFEEIDFLGYPFSISEEFQKRNTNATIEESLGRVEAVQNITVKANKRMVVYLSMGFGNPYGEHWHSDLVNMWSERLYKEFQIDILALSDTIGSATPEIVEDVFKQIIPALPNVEFGAHLHTVPENATKLIEAAYKGNCRRFDGAIKGFGGCPMAADDLTGNMPTEKLLKFLDKNSIRNQIDKNRFQEAFNMSSSIFI